jgi:aryl-alcohol dehydrogenase-like predicted oxidoreductase
MIRMALPVSRRELGRVLAGSALASASSAFANPMPTRRLGGINFEASVFGIGAQHLGDPGVEQSLVDRVIGEAIDSGVNYIDTAPPYHQSEERLGRALKGKRDKVFLVSKVETNAKGDALYQLEDSLRKLQTDHLDCVHMHNISRTDRFPDIRQTLAADGTLGALIEAKKKGMIRHIGCTSHMRPARALVAFETGQIELFMCVLNYVDRHTYGYEEKVLPEARKRNIGVIAMKVLGGPVAPPARARITSPDEYVANLRYVLGIPGVSVAIIGIRTVEELRQAVATARDFRPLTPAEMTRITERGKTLAREWGPLRGPVA